MGTPQLLISLPILLPTLLTHLVVIKYCSLKTLELEIKYEQTPLSQNMHEQEEPTLLTLF